MHVEISLRNQQKLPYLLELLRSLDFVESVNVRPETTTDTTSSAAPSLFDQFYGKAQSGLSLEQLDKKLNDLRNEWTRDF